MSRSIALICGLLVAAGLLSAPASAAPPTPSPTGSAPVSTTPSTFGSLTGQNGGALDSCRIGKRRVLVATGDVTAYTAARARKGVARVWFVDADTGKKLGKVTVSGRTATKNGERFDGGFVNTALCRPGAKGRTAKVYLGGSFTRVLGKTRRRTAMVELTPSRGRLKVRLDRWQVSSRRTVTDIAPAPKQLLVAGGTVLRSVSPTTAKARWSLQSRCGGVRTALYAARSVYVGGFFNAVEGPDGSVGRNHGLVKVDARTGHVAGRSRFRTVIPRNASCSGFEGSNPSSLVHDAKRKRIVACAAGLQNAVFSVSRSSGRRAWTRSIDGDGQVCQRIGNQVFVGHHRSGANRNVDARGCGRFSCGAMGAFLRLSDGTQTRWLPVDADFSGGGVNRDGRNNGISGATVIGRWFFVSGGFDRVGRTKVVNLARFGLR